VTVRRLIFVADDQLCRTLSSLKDARKTMLLMDGDKPEGST